MISRTALRVQAGLVGAALALPAQSQSTWYDAYEAGLAFQAKGQHAAAIGAFQRATALKPQPGTRVLTYGLNFMDTYYPWLKLAQSALASNQLDLAEEALKKSTQFGKEPAAEREALVQRLASLRAASKPAPTPAPAQPPTQTQPQPQPAPAQALPLQPAPTPAQQTPSAPPPMSAQPNPVHPQKGTEPAKTGAAADAPASKPTLPPAQIQSSTTSTPAAPAPSKVEPTLLPTTSSATSVPQPSSTRGWLWIGGSSLMAATLVGTLLQRRKKRPQPLASGSDHTIALPRSQSQSQANPDATAILSRSDMTQQGKLQMGGYTLHRVLGKGACGTTYMGVKDENGLEVAVKVPHPHMLEDGEFMARFRQEAALGSRLMHPKIVRILDPGPMEGTPWLAMELVKGHTLDQVVKEQAPFPLGMALDLALDITEAVAYAHSKGVVHRDLKPANVMVSDSGAQVLDFGIARLTEGVGMTATQVFIGTPLYASPESVSHSKVGPAADRYALGCILFEFLVGHPPYQGVNTFSTLQMHLTTPIPDLDVLRPGLPPRLVRLIERMMDKKPEQRPEDGEVITILKEIRSAL